MRIRYDHGTLTILSHKPSHNASSCAQGITMVATNSAKHTQPSKTHYCGPTPIEVLAKYATKQGQRNKNKVAPLYKPV